MKKIVKRLLALAILYFIFLLGLKLIGNQGMIVDRFALNPNQLYWTDNIDVWLIAIIPIVIGIIGLVLIVVPIYFPEYSYGFYEKIFGCLFIVLIIICILLAHKVSNSQKPYINVLKCINNKISIDEFESITDKSGEQLLYITRTDCKECINVTNELYHVLLKTGVRLQHYDTISDRVDNLERLNSILNKYGVTQVPTLLIFKDGLIVEHFEGLDIIDGIIKYSDI